MRSFLLHIILCIGLLSTSITSAQESDSLVEQLDIKYDESTITPLRFDKEALDGYRGDEAFDYIEKEAPDNWYTRFKQWLSDLWLSFWKWLTGSEELGGFFGTLIRILPYLLILGVLILLAWLLTRGDISGSPILVNSLGGVVPSDEEEIIESQDINSLIQQALEQKNYRLAIRYHYLLVLQQLKRKDLIDWQAEKTNQEYYYEIKDARLRDSFRKITRIYDFIWYGNFEVNEELFNKAEAQFTTTSNSI